MPKSFSRKDIVRLVNGVLCDQLGWHGGYLSPSQSIEDDLGADSLDLACIALALEGEFGIDSEIFEEDVIQARTVDGLHNLIQRHLSRAGRFVAPFETESDPGDEAGGPSAGDFPEISSCRELASLPWYLYQDEFGEYWSGAADGRFMQASADGFAIVPGLLRHFRRSTGAGLKGVHPALTPMNVLFLAPMIETL